MTSEPTLPELNVQSGASLSAGPFAQPPERDATPAEMKALAHPLRWRILRETLDAPLTNKQLARRLGRDPGTVLHHVRVLVDGGFLAAQDVRAGNRGALERPYRSTGKSWQIQLKHDPGSAGAILQAVQEEMAEGGEDGVLSLLRLGVRLSPEDVAALRKRLSDLGDEFAARDDPSGERIAILALVHRRRQ
ncbi:MAG: winged helix-turn-helix domain-containing protein [Candidatus Limnocylindrales bacterium]